MRRVTGRIMRRELISGLVAGCLAMYGCASFGAWRHADPGLEVGWHVRDAARGVVGIQEPAPLRAGAGRVRLQLAEPFPLAGYGDRLGTYAEGVHDPLHARACAISDGHDTVLIVSLDLVAVTQELFDAVYIRVHDIYPQIGREDVLLTATHTHSGVGAIGHRWLERLASGHFNQKIFDAVVDGTVAAVDAAMRELQPAALVRGEISIPSLIANRMEQDGLTEPRLRALKVVAASGDASGTPGGQPLAVITQWSAHATILGRENQLLSGDYPAAFVSRLEALFPGAVALMLTGPLGDQAPVRDASQPDQFAQVEAYSSTLTDSFAEALWGEPVAEADVRSVEVMLDLPAPQVRMVEPVPRALTRGLVRRQAPVQGIHIGDWMLFGIPGEPTVEVGRALEAAATADALSPWIVGLSNSYIGYIVSERQYALDEYESRMSSYGPKLAALLEHTVASLYEELTPEDDSPVPVFYLSGAPYEMGLQYGRQDAEAIAACYTEVFEYFEHALPLPMGRRGTMLTVLDAVWRATSPYVPKRYLDELRGVADGSGVPLKDLHRMHALAEVSATCSSFAVFGAATTAGRLIQSRNLDWNIRAGAHRYSRVFVYHPDGQRPFVSIGLAGFLGTLSGINAEGISIGEIGAKSAAQSYRGTPMPFLLRRVLEESGTLDQAIAVVADAPRTRGFNYVIGSSKERRAAALETNRDRCVVFDDEPNQIGPNQIGAVPYALPVADAVFRADTAMDPTVRDRQWASRGNPRRPGLEPPDGSGAYEKRYKVQANLVNEYFGRIDVPAAMEIARAAGPSSNIHSVIYAFPELYVAVARGTTPAVKRQYQRFDLRELLSRTE